MDAGWDFWVFGYGSLIWRPGFEFVERRRARLEGYRRAFCMTSIEYRGTPENPGLVLALDEDPGAACEGVAFLIHPEAAEAVRAYLHEREMGTGSYRQRFEEVEIDGRGRAAALCHVIDRGHEQYVSLPLESQAEIIAARTGPAGPNRDYLWNTVAHLRELGVRDEELEWLDWRVRRLAGAAAAGA